MQEVKLSYLEIFLFEIFRIGNEGRFLNSEKINLVKFDSKEKFGLQMYAFARDHLILYIKNSDQGLLPPSWGARESIFWRQANVCKARNVSFQSSNSGSN